MNAEIIKLLTTQFHRAVRTSDRPALVQAATALIGQSAPLGQNWLNVAIQLIRWGEVGMAMSAFDQWGRQGAPTQEADYEKAVLLAKIGRSSEALALLDGIATGVPNAYANAYLRGSLATNMGDLDLAESELRRTIDHNPQAGRAWLGLVQIGRLTADDEERVRALASSSEQFDMTDRAALESTLAITEHTRRNYADAFHHFARATAIQAEAFRYQAEDNLQSAEIVMRWTRERLAKFGKPSTAPRRSPIFLTGLPRSGTTLVEQILSAHSAVDGGAELGLALHLEATADGFAPEDIEKYLDNGGTLDDLRELYLRLVDERLPGTSLFVDKSLNQSRSLGPFSILFPDAPIIWMRRDPLDNAWSIFRSWLSDNVVGGWSLSDIAHHMTIEDRLLDHWQEQLGDRLLVLPYADLIEDPALWIGKLTAHCGLQLEPLQHTPHLSRRAVSTASAQQVREPINRKGLGVAEPYRAWLGAFIDAYGREMEIGPKSANSDAPPAKAPAVPPRVSAPQREMITFSPNPALAALSPRDLLDRLKQSMAKRDRSGINRIIGELVARKAPLGKQWRAMAMLSQHNGEYGLMRGVIDQWQREVGPMPDMLCEKARMEAQSGDPDSAWETVQQIDLARVDPLAIHFLKGTLSTSLGNLDAAADYLRTAVATAPASGQSWMALAMTGKMTDDDGRRMERARRAIVHAPPNEQATYQFALGRWKEKQKDYPAAFAAFEAGGALMARERRFDPANDQRNCDNALKFDRTKIDELAGNVTPRDHCRPLFVCGLPRSGTTLVEQILAAHSAVDGGGELGLMTTVEHDVGGNAPADLDAYLARGGSMNALRDLHDHLLQERFPGGGHVIDKTLNLSRTLGTVAAMYPEAKVVWMRRNPADCAWSAFRTYFMKSMDWSWRLDQIAEHFNLEDRLYRHWTEQLGDRILTVPYPDLVNDPAQWIERITRHFGLEPEAAQLESHKLERTVTTASAAQVREPINRKGIGTAAPYREMMKPFFDIYKGDML